MGKMTDAKIGQFQNSLSAHRPHKIELYFIPDFVSPLWNRNPAIIHNQPHLISNSDVVLSYQTNFKPNLSISTNEHFLTHTQSQ